MKTEKVGQRIQTFMTKQSLPLETLAQRTGLESAFLSTIIPKTDAEITESDVKDFCRGQIARYKIPKHVAFVDSFPLTASGKVQKYKLQEWSVERFPDPDDG